MRESRPEIRPTRRLLLLGWAGLLVCAATLFFHRLADRDLWSSHEARAAQNAESVLRDGPWSIPRLFDTRPELQKPPLYYWLVAGAAWCRGLPVDAWAVRLPAALAAWLGVVALGAALTWHGRPVAGWVAAAVLATALHYTWLARVGRIDMPLTLAVSVALLASYAARTNTGGLRPPLTVTLGCQLCAYLAVAVAVMLKGPIGVVLPAVVLIAHQLVERRSWSWRSSLLWGVPLVLLLTVPWFWWANHETQGEFFRVFFWRHNVERGFGGEDDGAMHARPWWFYGAHLFGDFLPWSLLLPFAGWYAVRNDLWRRDADTRFGLVWAASMILLLSCFRFKRADYLLPAFPGLALFLGCVAECWSADGIRLRRLVGSVAAVMLASLIGWGIYSRHVLPMAEESRDQRAFAAAIRQLAPPPQGVLLFRVEAHALAFHLGPPLNTFLEWENLDVWASRPGTHYILMTRDDAAAWAEHVTSGKLVEVLRHREFNGDNVERPLVLMRTTGGAR